jgi:hypothetical protein
VIEGLQPAKITLATIWRGASYQLTIRLYEDADQTEPLDYNGYSAKVDGGDLFTWTEQGAITTSPKAGEIVVALNGGQTGELAGGDEEMAPFALWLVNPEDDTDAHVALRGFVPVATPRP